MNETKIHKLIFPLAKNGEEQQTEVLPRSGSRCLQVLYFFFHVHVTPVGIAEQEAKAESTPNQRQLQS